MHVIPGNGCRHALTQICPSSVELVPPDPKRSYMSSACFACSAVRPARYTTGLDGGMLHPLAPQDAMTVRTGMQISGQLHENSAGGGA